MEPVEDTNLEELVEDCITELQKEKEEQSHEHENWQQAQWRR